MLAAMDLPRSAKEGLGTLLPVANLPRVSSAIRWLAAALALVLATPAMAQLRDVEAYRVILTADAPMQSGDSERFYRVADLKKGDMLTVDAESADWIRVAYPAGSSAFLKADQGEISPTGLTVKLKVESKLLAVHQNIGISGSWKSLLPTAAKPGTEFKLIETVKDKDGTVLGYRIAAPAEARGFVSTRSIRRATTAEVEAATKPVAKAEPAKSEPAKTETKTEAAKPATTGVREVAPTMPTMTPTGQAAMTTSVTVTPDDSKKPEAAKPEAPKAEPAKVEPAKTEPPAVDLTQPQQPTGQAPAAPAASAPATPAPGATEINQSTVPNATTADANAAAATETTPTRQPASSEPAATINDPTPMPEPVRPSSAEDLEPMFQAVRRQDVMTAEIDELLGEYQRLIPLRPVGDRRRRQLEQRAEMLRLMQDYRNQRRTLEEASAAARAVTDDMSKRFAQYDIQRQYAIVGILSPSSVYDGTRLPLMYRLQSIGGSVPRTLGYIKPKDELSLPSKLGVVVGVVGEQQVDSSLRLNVIDAVRVDELRASENPVRVTP
jgi:hypothetical protein